MMILKMKVFCDKMHTNKIKRKENFLFLNTGNGTFLGKFFTLLT